MRTDLKEEVLREALHNKIRKYWTEIAQKANNDPILGTPPNDITLFEHDEADLEKAICLGAGKAIETIDRTGRSHAPLAEDAAKLGAVRRGAFSEHAIARFFVDPDGQRGVVETIFGPHFERGFVFTVVEGKVRGSNRWVS